MSLGQFSKNLTSVSKAIENNEKIALPILAVRVKKAALSDPEDQTLSTMASILNKMCNSKMFISRGELKDLYKRLYSRNTKFAELFSEELGSYASEVNTVVPTIMDRAGAEDFGQVVQQAMNDVVDPVLANALNIAFGNQKTAYSNEMGKVAKAACSNQLKSLGFGVSEIEVVTGNSNIIVCKAAFETPKGKSHVLVPVELTKEAKPLIPSVFVGNYGPQNLTAESLNKYLVSTVGHKLQIEAGSVLKASQMVKNASLEDQQEVSDVELALTKLTAIREGSSEFMGNSVLGQNINALPQADIDTTIKNNEFSSFAEQFNSPIGLASFKFGADKVAAGRKVISQQLANFGFSKSQVSVIDHNTDTVFYAVALDNGRVAFRVPLKLAGKSLAPTMLIANGSMGSFDRDSIVKMYSVSEKDTKAAAFASPLYGLKASELVEAVRESVKEGNYLKAEDALNMLNETGEKKAYQTAFAVYAGNLNAGKQEEEKVSKCGRVVKNAHTQYALCGHTNLPLHKVYQDDNGDCHPLYRKAQAETGEASYFMSHKVILG